MTRAAAASLLLATACTAGPAPRAGPTTPPPTTAPATTAPATTAPATTEPDTDDAISFVTPSRNVACELALEYVECSIAARDWEPPEDDCGAGRAHVELFDASVRAGCGPTGAERATRVVGYGEAVTLDRVTCAVARTGVTCRFGPTGRGFLLSRARYRVYGRSG